MQNLEQKTRDILKKNYKDLPVAKDLPRLAKRISIYGEKGAQLLLTPNESHSVGTYIKAIFEALYQLFGETTLSEKLEEGWTACYDEKKELEKVMERFLAQYVGEESKSLQILKACNQGVISGAVIELKFALGITHTTKDVPNSWFFTITHGPDVTTVTSSKREICVQGVFEFQWDFTVSFDSNTLAFKGVLLKVTELIFHKAENTQKVEDVKRILARYLRAGEEKKTFSVEVNGEARPPLTPGSAALADTSFMLPGERIILQNRDSEYVAQEDSRFIGCAYITTFRIHFIPNPNKMKSVQTLREQLAESNPPDVPLTCIFKVKKGIENTVDIWCKDLRIVTYSFKEIGPRDLFYITVKKHIPTNKEEIYAYAYYTNGGVSKTASMEGWRLYQPQRELERLNLPVDKWRISNVNANFALCTGYPTVLAVPVGLTEEEVIAAGAAREGRIPTPVWRHPITGAFLCRAQKAKTKAIEDDQFVEALVRINPGNAFYILELKDDKLREGKKGKPTSSIQRRHEVLNLGSLESLKESFEQLAMLCYTAEETGDQWLTELSNTKWLDQLCELLAASTRIVELLEKGFSVLLESFDDTDRNPQLSGLVSLLLDPYFRTLNGFEALIEKEWLSFGHRFLERCGFLLEKNKSAPLFIQFLDCVWQLTQQFPNAFEFNSKFLVALMHHLFSGNYGTFLSNTNKDRVSLADSTASLWSFFNKTDKIADFLNGNYSTGTRLLLPSPSIKRLSFWSDYYLRWLFEAKSIEQSLLNKGQPVRSSSQSFTSTRSDGQRPEGPTMTISLEGVDKLTPKQMAKFKELQTTIETLKRENSNLQRQNKKVKDKYKKLKGAKKLGSLKKEKTVEESPSSGSFVSRSPSKKNIAFPGISLHTDSDFSILMAKSPKRSVSESIPKSERTQKTGWN